MYLCHRTIVYLLLVSLRTDFFGTGILLFVARPLPAAAARLDRVGFFASFSSGDFAFWFVVFFNSLGGGGVGAFVAASGGGIITAFDSSFTAVFSSEGVLSSLELDGASPVTCSHETGVEGTASSVFSSPLAATGDEEATLLASDEVLERSCRSLLNMMSLGCNEDSDFGIGYSFLTGVAPVGTSVRKDSFRAVVSV